VRRASRTRGMIPNDFAGSKGQESGKAGEAGRGCGRRVGVNRR
jgi:hypothetical protein